MLRKTALVILGTLLAVLGVLGLLLPVLPGVLLLLGAAGCFSLVSRRFRMGLEQRLEGNPRYRRALRRWQAGSGLSRWRRTQLAFWLTLGSLLPRVRR